MSASRNALYSMLDCTLNLVSIYSASVFERDRYLVITWRSRTLNDPMRSGSRDYNNLSSCYMLLRPLLHRNIFTEVIIFCSLGSALVLFLDLT